MRNHSKLNHWIKVVFFKIHTSIYLYIKITKTCDIIWKNKSPGTNNPRQNKSTGKYIRILRNHIKFNSHIVSWTNSFIQRTFIEETYLFLNSQTLQSKISNEISSYERHFLTLNLYNGTMDVWSPMHYVNRQPWIVYVPMLNHYVTRINKHISYYLSTSYLGQYIEH